MKMTPNGGVLSSGKPPQAADVTPGMGSAASIPLARPMMYKKGGKVKKTGWAIVHKGEKIMAEKKDKKKGGDKKKGAKKKVHVMHIRKAANEGYIATHDFEKPQGGGDMGDMSTPPSEDHVLPNIAALQDHVGDHMGPQEEEPEPPAQGLSGPGPGAAQGGMNG
jgi:hypothetical protein